MGSLAHTNRRPHPGHPKLCHLTTDYCITIRKDPIHNQNIYIQINVVRSLISAYHENQITDIPSVPTANGAEINSYIDAMTEELEYQQRDNIPAISSGEEISVFRQVNIHNDKPTTISKSML